MSILEQVATALSLWVDTVARVARAPLANMKTVRRIEAVEDDEHVLEMQLAPRTRTRDGELPPCRIQIREGDVSPSLPAHWAAAVRGGSVELALRPSRFVFRALELPNRAAEFLDGIIRSQIDRLTPWNADETAFHWTAPRTAGDRISLTVVATGRAPMVALARTFFDLGATSVEISTATAEQERVIVYARQAGGSAGFDRLRACLVAVLTTTGILAMLTAGVSGFVADSYDAQQQQISRRISEQRAIMQGNQGGAAGSPLEMLVRRKQTTPSSVLVLEELSALLPDHTYATEVRIDGDKLQIVGLTRDAPSLIQILEQSPHFSSAGFFAPTTRAANDPGERFHIEARLRPQFGSGT
ncbi:MAG: PilN domain-containing protein [Rhizobiales bacterium]|nr:PilN domain-containing protein [Hyphomicrobiales bacterium]